MFAAKYLERRVLIFRTSVVGYLGGLTMYSRAEGM